MPNKIPDQEEKEQGKPQGKTLELHTFSKKETEHKTVPRQEEKSFAIGEIEFLDEPNIKTFYSPYDSDDEIGIYEAEFKKIPSGTTELIIGRLPSKYLHGGTFSKHFAHFAKIPPSVTQLHLLYDSFQDLFAEFVKALPQSVKVLVLDYKNPSQRKRLDMLPPVSMLRLVNQLPLNIEIISFGPNIRPTQRSSVQQQDLNKLLATRKNPNLVIEGIGAAVIDNATDLERLFQTIIDERYRLQIKIEHGSPETLKIAKKKINSLTVLIAIICEASLQKMPKEDLIVQLKTWRTVHMPVLETPGNRAVRVKDAVTKAATKFFKDKEAEGTPVKKSKLKTAVAVAEAFVRFGVDVESLKPDATTAPQPHQPK